MLTMLGVIIGSACIVLVVTVALVGKRYVVGQIEGVGVNLIYAELVHTGDAQRTTLARRNYRGGHGRRQSGAAARGA